VRHVNPKSGIEFNKVLGTDLAKWPSAPASVLGYGLSTIFPVVDPFSRSRWASAASASGIENTVGVRT
jgi:hypothetical protein